MARAFSAPTPFRCAAAASTSASASTSRYSSRAVALGRRCRVAAWASGDPVPRTERLYGVDNDEDEMVQRFWRLWTGNAHCRHVVTHSPRGSVFRDPAEIEARVRRLHRFLPVVDVPMAFMREPELLRVSAEDLVRRAVRVKIALPFIDARAFHLAPAMLLASPDALADAAHALAQRGATTDKLRLQPDAILAELGYWDGDGDGDGDGDCVPGDGSGAAAAAAASRRMYARASPDASDEAATRVRVEERERGSKKRR